MSRSTVKRDKIPPISFPLHYWHVLWKCPTFWPEVNDAFVVRMRRICRFCAQFGVDGWLITCFRLHGGERKNESDMEIGIRKGFLGDGQPALASSFAVGCGAWRLSDDAEYSSDAAIKWWVWRNSWPRQRSATIYVALVAWWKISSLLIRSYLFEIYCSLYI